MRTAAILGAALALAASPACAIAMPKKAVKTRVVLEVELLDTVGPRPTLRFSGELSSPRHKCVKRRRVRVLRDVPGDEDALVGKARSNRDGTWAFTSSSAPQTRSPYYAKAKRTKRRGGRLRCRRGVSEPVYAARR